MTARAITFLVLFSAIAAVWGAVMVTYHVSSSSRWRISPAGRHLMATAGCFTWSAALTVANIVLGDYPGRFVIQVVSYGAFILIGVQRLALMGLQRRRERAQALAPPPSARHPEPSPERPLP